MIGVVEQHDVAFANAREWRWRRSSRGVARAGQSRPQADHSSAVQPRRRASASASGEKIPYGGRYSVGAVPAISQTSCAQRSRSARSARGVRRLVQTWRSPWTASRCPAATISRATPGCARSCSPTTKNVALGAGGGERVEHRGRAARVRPVVEGQPDRARAERQAARDAEHVAQRRHVRGGGRRRPGDEAGRARAPRDPA